MKTKFILLVAVFIILSAFTTRVSVKKPVRSKPYPFQIGYFSLSGQEYDAYGDGGGHVDAIYKTDNNENDVT